MRVAVVHYHLRRGGVSRVIEHALAALASSSVKIAVLSGDSSGMAIENSERVTIVPELDYRIGPNRIAPANLAESLRTQAARVLGGAPDVWHIHNHHLGKNTSLTAAVAALARERERMLLHIHDFPEDGRAENYRALRQDLGGGTNQGLRSQLYPVGPRISYGVLNRRDRKLLLAAGMPEARICWLPNPVVAFAPNDSERPEPPKIFDSLTLYPTRAIRRKNLGEAILWAALAPAGQGLGCSLAPENPLERPGYDRWVDFAEHWSLPVRFELGVGSKIPFASWITAADRLLTTSVAEGFGLAFLEPWLFEHPVVGRNLPEITGDFAREGVDLSHMYDRLALPVTWLKLSELEGDLTAAMRRVYERYGLVAEKSAIDLTWNSMIVDRTVDFGRLDERYQRRIIERLIKDPSASVALQPDRPVTGAIPPVSRNRDIIDRRFSLERYGQWLMAGYEDLMRGDSSALEWIDPLEVLNQFLDPVRFNLLRS